MSRRLLASGGSAVIDPPDDPDDPDNPGGGTSGWPTTTDPNILALRPTGRTIAATVTGTPGDSLADLLEEAGTEANANHPTGTPYGPNSPERTLTILLPPGTYQGGFTGGDWINIVGTTGNPEDVIITSNTGDADGTYHPTGVCYAEGVTFKAVHGSVSPKYCAHIGGSSATTFARCIFDATTADTGTNAGTVGMDGRPGTHLTFYQGEFYDVTGVNRNHGMNLHSGGLGPEVSKISFVDCTAPDGVGYDGAAGDEVYVIGGTIGGSIHVNSGTDVLTDLDNPVVGGATDITRNHTTWPKPDLGDKGFVDRWLDYYYPDVTRQTGTIKTTATVTDRAPMSLVANRIYYCPVPLTSTMLVNRYGLWTRSGSGKVLNHQCEGDRGLSPGQPFPNNYPADLTGVFNVNGTLPAGEWFTPPDVPRIRYHGEGRVWVTFKMPDVTGVTVDGSAELPGLHDCYYSDDNGTAKVKATAGTPFPIAHAAQVR